METGVSIVRKKFYFGGCKGIIVRKFKFEKEETVCVDGIGGANNKRHTPVENVRILFIIDADIGEVRYPC